MMGWLKREKLEYFENENLFFLRNEKLLNLCLRWHILRSYRFLAEVTFKNTLFMCKNKVQSTAFQCEQSPIHTWDTTDFIFFDGYFINTVRACTVMFF